MRLPFLKLDGAGNDFVGLDWRGKEALPEAEAASLARALCDRHHGVGADGVLFLQDPREEGTHFTMLYLNADGSVGSMCGNGARSLAAMALHVGAAPEEMRFLTGAGVYEARLVEGGRIELSFPDVQGLPEWRALEGPARPVERALFLHVGVPHAVVFVEHDLDLLEVDGQGRAVRHDPAFAPAGTNANFAQIGRDVIDLRTYERGVEAETLACGTGTVATALCAAWRAGRVGRQRQRLIPTGGAVLEVAFDHGTAGFSSITLTGPAEIRFRGECEVDLKAEALVV